MRSKAFVLSPAAILLVATWWTAPSLGAERFLPSGLAYVWWRFGVPEFEDFQIDVTIHNDLETRPGMYFQMYQGQIGDVGFYFGLQTWTRKRGPSKSSWARM